MGDPLFVFPAAPQARVRGCEDIRRLVSDMVRDTRGGKVAEKRGDWTWMEGSVRCGFDKVWGRLIVVLVVFK